MQRSTVVLVLAVLLAVVVSFLVGGLVGHRLAKESPQRPDTVYIVKWKPQPVVPPKDSIIVKWKTVPLPVHDTTFVHDTTAVRDSVLVDVPITEKTYTGDNYKATVRGFNPELTSLWINEKQTIIKVPVQKHWTFTIGPQMGYGITPKGWQPYAGGGFTFGYSF